MELIEAQIQQEIDDAKKKFEEECGEGESEQSRTQDETSNNVKKLEVKVTNLAKSVYEIFKQFDEFSGSIPTKE
jgi:hypothetical protein